MRNFISVSKFAIIKKSKLEDKKKQESTTDTPIDHNFKKNYKKY